MISLDVASNNIGPEGATALAGNKTLHSLNLHNNNIGFDGAKAFTENTTLTSLNVSSNKIGDEGAAALAENTTLTSINVTSNNIGPEGAKALARNKTLTSLDISSNKISDEGAQALAANKTLISLYAFGNDIGDEGAKAFAENTTLTLLDVFSNNIGDEGAKALTRNTTLISLDVCKNNIGSVLLENIKDRIVQNQKARELLLEAVPVLAFFKANQDHSFQESIFPLLPAIAKFADEKYSSKELHAKLYSFLATKFGVSQTRGMKEDKEHIGADLKINSQPSSLVMPKFLKHWIDQTKDGREDKVAEIKSNDPPLLVSVSATLFQSHLLRQLPQQQPDPWNSSSATKTRILYI